jgi:hypothetical protein
MKRDPSLVELNDGSVIDLAKPFDNVKFWKHTIGVLLVFVVMAVISGCNKEVHPAPKFKLTMTYPDGRKKVFVGVSVRRNNSSGEWSYLKINPNGMGERCTFKGIAECEPVVDVDLFPVASESVATYAEDPNIKQGR